MNFFRVSGLKGLNRKNLTVCFEFHFNFACSIDTFFLISGFKTLWFQCFSIGVMCLNRVVIYSLYVLLVVLTFMGLICFTIRSITCCLTERQSSYQCQNFTVFSNSLELELAWLVLQHINYGICICVIVQVREFLGWYEVYYTLELEPISTSGLMNTCSYESVSSFHWF